MFSEYTVITFSAILKLYVVSHFHSIKFIILKFILHPAERRANMVGPLESNAILIHVAVFIVLVSILEFSVYSITKIRLIQIINKTNTASCSV